MTTENNIYDAQWSSSPFRESPRERRRGLDTKREMERIQTFPQGRFGRRSVWTKISWVRKINVGDARTVCFAGWTERGGCPESWWLGRTSRSSNSSRPLQNYTNLEHIVELHRPRLAKPSVWLVMSGRYILASLYHRSKHIIRKLLSSEFQP